MKLAQPVDKGNGEQGRARCRLLEQGELLVLPQLPFALAEDDRTFLMAQQLAGGHKNIAYAARSDTLTGFTERRGGDGERLRRLMRAYSEHVTTFVSALLPPYADSWLVDLTSFRPQEEQNRPLSPRSRNDLLHTDAFPSRPTNGDRILRIFTNINPHEARQWVTAEPFDVLVRRFTAAGTLPRPSSQALRRRMAAAARAIGMPVVQRSPYDAFMLRFHDYLKSNREFQATCDKRTWEFPPRATWIVFTDFVPHAVISGRGALEQTYIVTRQSLVLPERAPLRILEHLYGMSMTTPAFESTASARRG